MLSYIIIYFLGGLLIGSFLNVVIARLDTAESIVLGSSKCPKCKKPIKWYNLVPIFSFIFLRGRCADCNEKISWQYPLVEIASGLIFILSFILFGLSWQSVFTAIILDLMLSIVVFDLKEYQVPESLSWLTLILALIGQLAFNINSIGHIIVGAVISGGVIILLVYLSKGKWMGDGDIKIAIILGLMLGFPVAIFGIFLAFIIGAVLGSILLAFKIKKSKDQLPFTPFLLSSLIISLIWGQQIVDWYLGRYII